MPQGNYNTVSVMRRIFKSVLKKTQEIIGNDL